MIIGLDDFIKQYADEVLAAASQSILDAMVADAPVDTGELRDSSYGPVDVGDLAVIVGFDAPQSDWTDQGTIPHPIYPVNASRLRFFWENGPNGPDVYSFTEVFHPGQEGTGWFSDKVDAWDDWVQSTIEELS